MTSYSGVTFDLESEFEGSDLFKERILLAYNTSKYALNAQLPSAIQPYTSYTWKLSMKESSFFYEFRLLQSLVPITIVKEVAPVYKVLVGTRTISIQKHSMALLFTLDKYVVDIKYLINELVAHLERMSLGNLPTLVDGYIISNR